MNGSYMYYYDRYWGLFLNHHPDQTEADFASFEGVGYSGNRSMLNDITVDYLSGRGPLPAGLYTITLTNNEKGPLTHHLEPDPKNEMFGRSGFLIHGDKIDGPLHNASDGCIVSPAWTREIFKVGDRIQIL